MKYQSLLKGLREGIVSGKYAPGSKLPSENELALQFGVSRPTAGRALKELQAAGAVDRRVGSGSFVRTKRARPGSLKFGLLVPGLGNTEILDPVCNEITRYCQTRDAAVLWGATPGGGGEMEQGLALCRQYIDAGVDGVFLAPFEHLPDRFIVNQTILDTLKKVGIAVVLLDRDVPEFPGRGDCDLVGLDNFQAGFVLGEHLLGLGHRELRFLARPAPPSTTDLRLAGCREAAARRSLFFRPDWVWHADPSDEAAVRRLIKPRPPEAVICSNDQTAALLIQTLAKVGLAVPERVAVVGFDDVTYSTLLATPLTTMRQPTRDIGRLAVMTMLERLQTPDAPSRQVLLNAQLVVRQSCGAKSFGEKPERKR